MLHTLRNYTKAKENDTLNWKLIVLFIPLLMPIIVMPTGLSSRIAIQKGLASLALTNREFTDVSFQHPVDMKKTGNVGFISANQACDTLCDNSIYIKLNRLYAKPRFNSGQCVVMTGFVALDTVLGINSFFLARMMVACCAADAMPVGFYCIADTVPGVRDGDWVQLQGVVEPKTVKMPWNDKELVLPILNNVKIWHTDAPKRQYIYPVSY
jgi:putative membrane protein